MAKVSIIGAGIGGLSAAARLLKNGFEVEIHEKNCTVGGKTNILTLGDYKFDLTASLLLFPNDYTEVFTYCNKDYSDYFNLITLDNLYNAFYYDKSSYSFKKSLPMLCNTINTITNNSLKDSYGFFTLITENYKKYKITENYFLNKSFIKISHIINTDTLIQGTKLNSFSSCYSECTKYITNEKLINYIMFQAMYVGVSPYSSPNIYNLIPCSTPFLGISYITGGLYAYISALKQLVLDLGGKIYTSSPVEKIIIKDNTAIGINVNNKNIYSDIVLCSSDYSYSISNLISTKKSPTPLEHSCSTFILYLAVNKKYPQLDVHNIYINDDFKNNIESPFKGYLSKNPSLYIYCPSSIDTTLCPNGCETINIMLRVPNLTSTKLHWNKSLVSYLEKQLLSIIKNIKGLEDIEDHIVAKSYTTPITFQKDFNTYAGSAFGLSHTLTQSLFLRPQCRLKEINNLYFTGASIHPGNGISMVLKSSKICTEEILKTL